MVIFNALVAIANSDLLVRLHNRVFSASTMLAVILGVTAPLSAQLIGDGRRVEHELAADNQVAPHSLREGLWLRVADGDIVVQRVSIPPSAAVRSQAGLVVWSESGRDRWKWLPSDDFDLGEKFQEFVSLVRYASRGESEGAVSANTAGTTQIDQLLGQFVLRGAGFLTPPERGVLLDGRLTIRRQDNDKLDEPFPADEWTFSRDGRAVLRLGVDAGEEMIRLADINGLPEEFQLGLTPGEYTLRAKVSGASTTFRVVLPNERMRIERPINELKKLLADANDPLVALIGVETFLSSTDTAGNPQPFLADALDLLDRQHNHQPSNGRLAQLREQVMARLKGKLLVSNPSADATGIEVIDDARSLITAGNWQQASDLLDTVADSADQRTQGLVQLYRGVILAESGQATGGKAEAQFLEALDILRTLAPIDQLRVHNNLASYLLNRAQDRIYHHPAQIASGVSDPLLSALLDWHAARQHFLAGQSLSEKVSPTAIAAVRVNVARSYNTLADWLRVLNDDQLQPAFRILLDAAEKQARQLAIIASGQPGAETDVLGVAEETLAHLAFRNEDFAVSRQHGEAALQHYLKAGNLVGCESMYRLFGLVHLKSGEASNSNKAKDAALRDLLVSHKLCEMLRERIPKDQVGLGRAGFLARRTYINEKIIELLIGANRPAEALQFAELAKARTLEDVLAANRTSSTRGGAGPHGSRENGESADSDLLKNWPAGVAALEYFIGSERAWVFVVSSSAEVQAFPLLDAGSKPIASRELITRVQQLVESMDKFGPREGRRVAFAASRRKSLNFDRSWQDELHWFYLTLIPEAAREILRGAETVVVVPHHLLHYFPFVALVTQRDLQAPDGDRMPLPQFLVEEPYTLVYAPSLATWQILRSRDNRPLEQWNVMGIVDFGGREGRLNGVQTEIDNLRAIFGTQINEVVAEAEATETRLREMLGRPGVVSISTHGQKVPDRPLEAFLICQPDDKQDGLLRAGELYEMEIQSDLVLLNACYGGYADRSPLPADDLFGVQRALLHGGARTVISGTWDIYDATAPDIMNDFWKQIAAGTAAPRALAEAQRAYLKSWREFPQEPFRLLTHPYYWAVFTVSGDDRTGSKTEGVSP